MICHLLLENVAVGYVPSKNQVKFEQIIEITCHVLLASRIDLLKVFQNILTRFRLLFS